ncbi:hypothetical protein QJS66_21485 [Kocuria rhizophila]|nr:hypothetical protein QJS66_21485 [Kocuria rhizophila]
MRSVGTESGLSAGTVQYHYRTRKDLLVAALERFRGAADAARHGRSRSTGSPRVAHAHPARAAAGEGVRGRGRGRVGQLWRRGLHADWLASCTGTRCARSKRSCARR